jgi:hypothetical protein
MKKSDFKRILKPLIKECIKEVIFEEGVLSNVITEVVKSTRTLNNVQFETQPKQQIVESVNSIEQKKLAEEQWKKKRDQRRKLLNAAGFDDVDIFEGTEPLRTPLNEGAPQGPLSNLEPGDSGVDISGILNLGGRNWQKLARGK